jgi:hypoxanthine phosphoribosyltransferase
MIELKDIQIKDLKFTPYILRDEIMDRILELGLKITQDYDSKKPLFLSILNGSFMFTSDLLKRIDLESEVKFLQISSYEGTSSTGKIKGDLDLGDWITDRHIIIVEDIIDTGTTMNYLLQEIKKWNPTSVEVATLFLKKGCLQYNLNPLYVGFDIKNEFIVGYGLDYDGLGRNYQDVYQLID